jgi:chemotaxis protein MotA
MDFSTLGGLIIGLIIVVVVLMLDGGSPAELFAAPSAILLIIGGSLASSVISSPLKLTMALPKIIGKAFINEQFKFEEALEFLVKMTDRARRDGLLVLEEEAKNITDPFLKSGLMMVVDGVDPDQVHRILESKIDQVHARHRAGYGFFAAAGGFAPTFGIIGTVMGLISVLKQLDDPNSLARSIAVAFLATLWGLMTANLIYLPIGNKLKAKSEEEVHFRELQMQGIVSIQAGENPQIVREKLTAFLPPVKEKAAKEPEAGAPNAAAQKAKA